MKKFLVIALIIAIGATSELVAGNLICCGGYKKTGDREIELYWMHHARFGGADCNTDRPVQDLDKVWDAGGTCANKGLN